ncbi:phosphate/phosphite/phosphonate ABC transporter substrate-binding protein [Aquisalimonas asiatica]|uniref:Phosphonate transport system substrate-binding protein n=1 Tax=Aquisalimonas asiatica TaxID=406100 RepID=A0A1H8RRC6_9GAMM|nr:PhnD/SsuA/transferrin family substrate-binding protein [Aquisalimonas asiatica]SEO69169.1 phosphonate transport system substrate-binding protein [Aquisalimonas asiatica]
MRNVTALVAAAALTAPAFALASPAEDVADYCDSPLRLADTGIEGAEELRRAFAPFAEEFTELTGVEMEFFPLSDRTSAANALRYDSIDLVLAGPSEYVVMTAVSGNVSPAFGLERDGYGAYIVAHSDLGLNGIEDLEGKHLAFGSVGSTTNHITQGWMIEDAGLSLGDDVRYTHAGDARVQTFVNGDVDAAAVGYRDVDIIEEYDPDLEYDIIADSGTMPRDVFVARDALGEECIQAISDTAMAYEDALFQAFVQPAADEPDTDEGQERSKYLGAKFVDDITDEEYDMVREAYEVLGLEL